MIKTIMAKTNHKKARKAVHLLTYLIPLGIFISVVNVTLSMCTSNWLHSFERIQISNTSIMEEFITTKTVSGLWTLCSFNLTENQMKEGVTSVDNDQMNCTKIEYFVKDRYTSDPNDSANAIRYAVVSSGPLFVVAAIFLGVALIAAVFGLYRHRRIFLFISGIIFIISGLGLLIGLVVYLSALQSEIGPKLRPKNAVDLPQFSYKYGYSFGFLVIGFMATEMTGILATFYYIYWHQIDWTEKLDPNNPTHGSRISLRGNGKTSDSSSTFRCQSHLHPIKGYKIMDIYDPNSTKSNSNSKIGMQHQQSCTSCGAGVNNGNDFDIPFPPPPPPTCQAYFSNMPRDYTNSDEEGSILFPLPVAVRGKESRNNAI